MRHWIVFVGGILWNEHIHTRCILLICSARLHVAEKKTFMDFTTSSFFSLLVSFIRPHFSIQIHMSFSSVCHLLLIKLKLDGNHCHYSDKVSVVSHEWQGAIVSMWWYSFALAKKPNTNTHTHTHSYNTEFSMLLNIIIGDSYLRFTHIWISFFLSNIFFLFFAPYMPCTMQKYFLLAFHRK